MAIALHLEPHPPSPFTWNCDCHCVFVLFRLPMMRRPSGSREAVALLRTPGMRWRPFSWWTPLPTSAW